MIKRFVIAGVLLAVVFGGIVGFNIFRDNAIKKAFSTGFVPTVTVSATTATVEDWPRHVDAVGSLQAIQFVDVAPQVSGLVTAIDFEAGQRVKKGDVLVRIDDAVERADLKRLEATRRLAVLTYDRAKKLSQNQYSTQANVDQAKATLDQTDADIAKVRAQIDYKVIRAPFSGELGVRSVNLGQYVGPGTKLVGLEALDKLFANLTVPEQRLAVLRVGQSVNVTVDAFKNRTFAGRVSTIDPRLDQANRTVLIQATIDNPDLALRPGMFVDAQIGLGATDKVVTVPKTAIDYSLYGDSVYVVVPIEKGANGKPGFIAEQRTVQVGDQRGGRIAILKGVSANDKVVIAGQIKLRDGLPVIIDNTIKLAPPDEQASAR